MTRKQTEISDGTEYFVISIHSITFGLFIMFFFLAVNKNRFCCELIYRFRLTSLYLIQFSAQQFSASCCRRNGTKKKNRCESSAFLVSFSFIFGNCLWSSASLSNDNISLAPTSEFQLSNERRMRKKCDIRLKRNRKQQISFYLIHS